MDDVKLAAIYVYELFNVADHVARCAEGAQVALRHGDVAEAWSNLEACKRSAELFDMRWRDALEKVLAAKGGVNHG